MVQSAMLVALGFLLATFLSLLLAPVVWKRAARLATDRLKASLPISLTDFHAEKDQLRANHAIQMRGLELALEEAKNRTAEQMVDIGRQRSEIMTLTSQIRELRSSLSERKSLIAVMEQTLNANVPRLKERLEAELGTTMQLNEKVQALEGTVRRKSGQLEESGRHIKLREGEIQKLRQEISGKGGRRSSSLFSFGKTRKNGVLNGVAQTADIDLSTLDMQEGGKGVVVLKALQQENRQLHQVIEKTKDQLLHARNFEEKEVPLLRQEMRQLGTDLLRSVEVPSLDGLEDKATEQKKQPPVVTPEVKVKRSLSERLKTVASGGSVSS